MMNTEAASIQFYFANEGAAASACDTLREIGYEAEHAGAGEVRLQIENQDVESALEICQLHGGQLQLPGTSLAYDATPHAYEAGGIIIPAHTVNEDWSEAYSTGAIDSYQSLETSTSGRNISSDSLPEPDVDGFSGSVKA